MEKTNTRVHKRYMTIATLALSVTLLTAMTVSSKQPSYNSEQTVTQAVSGATQFPQLTITLTPTPAPTPIEETAPVVEQTVEEVLIPQEEQWKQFRLTHYVYNCRGCSGTTYSGVNIKGKTTYEGYKILSVDTREIALGSIVEIDDGVSVYEAIAIDTGGAIKGRKLDLVVGSVSEANKLGVKYVNLKVVREGWGE